MEYLEKLYHKCKEDGHFNKFNTYIEFTDYFKNIETYRKLWDFLLTKGYKIPDFEEFLTKVITPQANQNNKETNVDELIHVVRKWGAFKQPIPAVDKIVFNEENGLKLPDLIRFGEINCDGNNQPIPALLPFSKNGGITLWTSNQEKKDIANKMIEVLTYRLLLSIASNQAKIYVIDNEKNGVSFSSLFGLDSKILVPEIWDDENEILEGLTDLKNQVPIVLSKYLQNIYYDLAEYNEKISHSNQPFQFVLVANFPRGFNNESASKLKNLIENGHKAGIFILMSVDTKAKCPDYMTIDEFKTINSVLDLNSNMVHNVPNLEYYNSKFYISSYDTELPKDLDSIKTRINAAANKVKAVKIDVTSSIGNEWSENAANGIKIPVGITQSNETIYFELGQTVHHALVGGATGSGKSVLLHNIILNGAQLYSPLTLQFILLDYKEGTEFIIYDKLPHIKILSVECEKSYGISVLEFLLAEITARGKLFKEFGAGDLNAYINSSGNVLPRFVLIIDEFQVLLGGSGSFSTKAAEMIEDISRRGRSFGVNMILATQSLADVDISSSTLSQLGLRIGMKMSENDCNRILDINNNIPAFFDRPGQAVYNTKEGKKEGNIEFQSAFMSKEDISKKILYLEEKNSKEFPERLFKQYIEKGNKLIGIEANPESKSLHKINNSFADIFVGEPAFLQEDHVKIRIRKQAASNVIMVGDEPCSTISFVYNAIRQLIKQSSTDSKFYVFDLFDIDSGFQGNLDELKSLTENIKIYSKDKPLKTLLEETKTELENRFNEDGGAFRLCIVILNVQRIRDLRKDGYSDSELSTLLGSIIKDGPDYGIHCMLHVLNNNQFLECFDTKLLNEFENKIIFKGEEPSKYIDDYSISAIKHEGMAYIISPNTRYSADLVKIYQKNVSKN